MILIVALVAAQATLFDPTSMFARVAMVVPFTAPIVHPILIAAGAIGVGEVVLAIVSTVVTLAVLVPLVARIYRGGVLPNGGTSGLRAAWRAGR
jgi:ABC-2 type transport system permease protein